MDSYMPCRAMAQTCKLIIYMPSTMYDVIDAYEMYKFKSTSIFFFSLPYIQKLDLHPSLNISN